MYAVCRKSFSCIHIYSIMYLYVIKDDVLPTLTAYDSLAPPGIVNRYANERASDWRCCVILTTPVSRMNSIKLMSYDYAVLFVIVLWIIDGQMDEDENCDILA